MKLRNDKLEKFNRCWNISFSSASLDPMAPLNPMVPMSPRISSPAHGKEPAGGGGRQQQARGAALSKRDRELIGVTVRVSQVSYFVTCTYARDRA